MGSARRPPLRQRGLGSWLAQAAILVALGALVAAFLAQVAANLNARGIASGFDFLDNRSGFAIIQHLIAYSEESTYLEAFLVGVLNTALASGLAILLATPLGFGIGIGLMARNVLVAGLARIYVEAFRNIPLLILIVGVYFVGLRPLPGPRQSLDLAGVAFLNNRGLFLPAPVMTEAARWGLVALVLGLVAAVILGRLSLRQRRDQGHVAPGLAWAPWLVAGLGVAVAVVAWSQVVWDRPALRGFNFAGGVSVIPELVALVLALGLFTAAFIAEITRAGLEAVSKGQREAAAALGLHGGQSLRLVILPQAIRVIVPPLTSEYLNVVKNSSLAAAIAYPDLVQAFAGTVLNQTGQAVEVIAMVMAVYLVLSLILSAAMSAFERRHRWATR